MNFGFEGSVECGEVGFVLGMLAAVMLLLLLLPPPPPLTALIRGSALNGSRNEDEDICGRPDIEFRLVTL